MSAIKEEVGDIRVLSVVNAEGCLLWRRMDVIRGKAGYEETMDIPVLKQGVMDVEKFVVFALNDLPSETVGIVVMIQGEVWEDNDLIMAPDEEDVDDSGFAIPPLRGLYLASEIIQDLMVAGQPDSDEDPDLWQVEEGSQAVAFVFGREELPKDKDDVIAIALDNFQVACKHIPSF